MCQAFLRVRVWKTPILHMSLHWIRYIPGTAVDTLFSLFSPASSATCYTEYDTLDTIYTWYSSRHSLLALLTCIIRFSLSDSPCLFAVFRPWILSVRSVHSALALHMQPHTRHRRRIAHPASKGTTTWKAVKTCDDATSAATPGLVCGYQRREEAGEE